MSEKRKKAVSMRLRIFWYRRQLVFATRRVYGKKSAHLRRNRRFFCVLRTLAAGGMAALFLLFAAAGAAALMHPVMRETFVQVVF